MCAQAGDALLDPGLVEGIFPNRQGSSSQALFGWYSKYILGSTYCVIGGGRRGNSLGLNLGSEIFCWSSISSGVIILVFSFQRFPFLSLSPQVQELS